MTKPSVTYTVGEIPRNRPFRIEGIERELFKNDRDELDSVDRETPMNFIEFFTLLSVTAKTETDSIRPIYSIDPTTIVASFQNNFLMDTGDGYTLETFTPDGEVHFARYFRPQNLHRAVAALQEFMPEQIPH